MSDGHESIVVSHKPHAIRQLTRQLTYFESPLDVEEGPLQFGQLALATGEQAEQEQQERVWSPVSRRLAHKKENERVIHGKASKARGDRRTSSRGKPGW